MRTVPLLLSALLLVRAHALRADELTSLFKDSVVFTNVGYTGGANLISNFPLRVDLSTTRPNGFEYDLAGLNASQVRFNYHVEYIDHATNAVLDTTVNYAVTNWNADGVSTLYVQLPFFSNNPTGRLTMHWNPVDYAELPENSPLEVTPAVVDPSQSDLWNQSILAQESNPNFIACAPAHRRVQSAGVWKTKLLNYWLEAPSISKSSWRQGEASATVGLGVAASAGASSVEYYDRSDNTSYGSEMPVVPGAYRAVVTVDEDEFYAKLTRSLEFVIASGASVDGVATTNDFANLVTFLPTGSAKDTSLAAQFAAATAASVNYNFRNEINAAGAVSMGCWFRFNTGAKSTYTDRIVLLGLCGYDSGEGPLAIHLNNNSSSANTSIRLVAWASDGSKFSRKTLIDYKSTTWTDGKWHFVMATRRASTGEVKLYFDGQCVQGAVFPGLAFYNSTTASIAARLGIGCDPVALGTKTGSSTDSFSGYLAEAQVYARELDADTIRDLYTTKLRLDGNEPGLVAYYPINDVTTEGERSNSSFADACANGTRHPAQYTGKLVWSKSKTSDLPLRIGVSTLKTKPVLICLKDGSPAGFAYSALKFGATVEGFYSDVRFYDEFDQPLNYRIDYWNPEGESYIWVKVPNLSDSSRITMCWGQGADTVLPANDPAAVWSAKTPESEIDAWREFYLNDYANTVRSGFVIDNPDKRLQNRWIVEPSFTFTQWAVGSTAPSLTLGRSMSGVPTVAYYDRSTGARLAVMPTTEAGEYRAVFHCVETPGWSALEKQIEFRIVNELPIHDLGDFSARVLLANNDESVAGGEVYAQSYDNVDSGWGMPYWKHHEYGSDTDVTDFDSTRLFAEYNLFAGTCHEYMSGTTRLWGLEHVRFGNLFNNGKYHPSEQGETGLNDNQNYLPWNPSSERMLSYQGLEIGQFHRYAGTFLLQNVCDDRLKRYAQICSPCYDDGIGTIYFDVVNAFTDNVRDDEGNANYEIVVEVATNVLENASLAPVDGVWPLGIWSASSAGEIYNAYSYADWHAVPMQPVRFRADTGVDVTDCERLPATTNLVLDITDGGSLKNFYRVYVPLNYSCPARFRIRRTRIDESASLNPDADAFIIVDNVICSPARKLVSLEPYGWLDPQKNGKQYLGREGAFTPAFPGPKDVVTARVKAVDSLGDEVPAGTVTAVTMHYRWRYLNQRQSAWQTVDFSPSTLTSLSPLVLPGLPGDVEFWFEGAQNYGYYAYANYSGTKLGVPWYSEAFSLITNGLHGAAADWNVRVREGSSDYEGAVLVVRESDSRVLEVPMELVDNRQWRGYYQTTNALSDGAWVRFELRNKQTRGEKWSWNTNHLYCAEKGGELALPYCGRLSDGATNLWAHVPVDASTGYLMFQIDETSRGLSVVRADYQNFNHWTDGYGEKFVGTAADDSALPASGVSPLTRDFLVDYRVFTNQVEVVTNDLWNLDFETQKGYTYYSTFPAGSQIVNGWKLGKGRFVYGSYKMPGSGTALHMNGGSEGYVELSDHTLGKWPRGIEKVTFSARLAQAIDFKDFAYCETDVSKKNYAFVAHTAFDHDSNLSFSGNASVSMVAYYRANLGCYEARWEQVRGKVDTHGTVTGPDLSGQKLSIYRWNATGNGMEPTLLYEVYNGTNTGFNFSMPVSASTTALADSTLMPMSLAVYQYNDEGDVMIVAGVYKSGAKPKADPTGSTYNKWAYAAYLDHSDKKLTSGSYGVVTANCPGLFVRPRVSTGEIAKGTKFGDLAPTADTGKYTNGDKTYPAALSFDSCRSEIDEKYWLPVPGRTKTFSVDDFVYGFQAADIGQTIDLLAAKSDGKFTERLASFTISNHWGAVGAKSEFGAELPLVWRAADANFRLQTGGNLDQSFSPAVVIDNVKTYQWRGKNQILLYESGDSPDSPNECPTPKYSGDPGNFVYTGGWVQDEGIGKASIEFSAKRTIIGRPAGVRTPLMDGLSTRGNGLGNLIFAYHAAQTNVALLVQVATNVTAGEIKSKTILEGDVWQTVARLDYSTLGPEGVTNIAFSIRTTEESRGPVARVILDPELVKAVTNVTDETAFGSIRIDYVTCQDEPPIDKGCWWGWNLRTLGNVGDTEKRMYLPDPSLLPNPGCSLALNNSITADIDETKRGDYYRHMPFLQSPSFTNNVIGQISFRARKYGSSDRDQAGELALYGITSSELARSGEWKLLTRFTVSNAVFTAYSYRVAAEDGYCAFRLGVPGVKGVDPQERGPKSQFGDNPVRVLLDEVLVCEAINPELAFRSVGAFRTDISGTSPVSGVPGKSEQPLAGESWGVQCELYAVMLEEEIDTSRPPRVKLYWYEGDDLWGYDKWKTKAHSAWLARATGTDALIYRSSCETAPDAVISQSTKEPGGLAPVVQYMLEVFYTTVDLKSGEKRETSRMIDVKNGEWSVPEWYQPLDYNTDSRFGAGKSYSCFCVLDDLAPGWAWINEVNIFNFDPVTYNNADYNCQYVEIAAPREFDLSGWRVEMVENVPSLASVRTNTVAVFGDRGLSGTKSLNMTSNYVFHVIANPDHGTEYDRSILKDPGALDGTWKFENTTGSYLFRSGGELDFSECVGIRLVRPNGIVEHELVTIGTNVFSDVGMAEYSPTGVVAQLNAVMKPGRFFYAGQDSCDGRRSIGVVNEQGGRSDVWNNTMKCTPGTINEGQQINPDYPVPMGEMMSVYVNLDQSGGNIWQSLDGGMSFTNESQRIYVRNGSTIGTNIIYQVESWYEIDYVRQLCEGVITDFDVTNTFDRALRRLEVTIGKGCSNRVTVTARATPDRQLKELGCDENNVYTPAVIDWLQQGTTMKRPFVNDDGVIRRAEFQGLYGTVAGYLSLTEMYWLDIDPTVGDMVLKAGMSKAPTETLAPLYPGYDGPAFVTNLKMSVFMMITNKTTDASSPYYAAAWSPYVLRGVEPGDISHNYTNSQQKGWTSASFKISGILPNGHTSEKIRENWVDLRWFYFLPDSFYQIEDEPAHPRFTTDIEVRDPVNCIDSPGYGAGWYDWVHDPDHPERASVRPFFRWGLDTRLKPYEVEPLKKQNFYAY